MFFEKRKGLSAAEKIDFLKAYFIRKDGSIEETAINVGISSSSAVHLMKMLKPDTKTKLE